MIETYGQTPARLFSEPHPDKKRTGIDQYSSWSGTFGDIEVQSQRSPIERAARGIIQGNVLNLDEKLFTCVIDLN